MSIWFRGLAFGSRISSNAGSKLNRNYHVSNARRNLFASSSLVPKKLNVNLENRSFATAAEIPDFVPSNLTIHNDELLFTDVEENLLNFDYTIQPGPKTVPFFGVPQEDDDTNLFVKTDETRDLNPNIFATEVRHDIVHRVVKWQLAKRRAGDHSVKGIDERSGTGRKPHPQKGTGRARQGTKRAPHMKKGGRVHGPKPRDFEYSLPKKVRQFGIRSVLSARYIEESVCVVDSIYDTSLVTSKDIIKTKEFEALMAQQDWKSVLFICKDCDDINQNLMRLGTRNLPKATVLPVVGLNVYQMLQYKQICIVEDALPQLDLRLDPVLRKELKRKPKFTLF